MNAEMRGWSWKRSWLTAVIFSAAYLVGILIVAPARADDAPKTEPAKESENIFFSVEGAKDCAFDESRNRLYVTTPNQLVVVDTKERRVLPGIDLQGSLQACDISPDFKHLAIGPIKAQFIYWLDLAWTKAEDMEFDQVRFKADSMESGVFSLCIGSDNSVLFSMTFAGSGQVKLRRFVPDGKKVTDVGQVSMNAIVTPSGDRHFAAVAEGNISSGPLNVFDFKENKLKPIANLQRFNYEIGCAAGAKYFASPGRKGCDLYDSHGGKLGSLDGTPAICAAFHPKFDSIFLMRAAATTIEEYGIDGKKLDGDYPLDKPLVINGDVHRRIVTNIYGAGNTIIANSHRVTSFNARTFQSGRLKISESGQNLFAVTPTGVYMFAIKPRTPSADADSHKPKIKVIDANPGQ